MSDASRMLAIVLIAAGILPCKALHSRCRISVAAWSTSGLSVLLHERVDGPEGGGSSTYWILDETGEQSSRWQVSSDFSPGNGSTPERISEKECRRCVEEMRRELEKRELGIMVDVNPAGCEKDRRGEVVRLLPHRPDHRDSPWRVAAGPCRQLLIRTARDTAVLPGVMAEPEVAYGVSVGPGGRMVVVIGRGERGTVLVGAWRCRGGDVTRARPIESSFAPEAPGIEIRMNRETRLTDSLSARLSGFSHKRPYRNGPTKATAYLTLQGPDTTEDITLSVHGIQGKPGVAEHDTLAWGGYLLMLKQLNYDSSVVITVRPNPLPPDSVLVCQ